MDNSMKMGDIQKEWMIYDDLFHGKSGIFSLMDDNWGTSTEEVPSCHRLPESPGRCRSGQ